MTATKRNTKPQKQQQRRPRAQPRPRNQGLSIATGTVSQTRQAKINSKKGLVLEHEEVFHVLNPGTTDLTMWTTMINPALEAICPWFFRIAENFETYLPEKLEICFKPVCPTTSSGVVAIAVDYDALDELPETLTDLTSYSGSVHGPVYRSMTFKASPSDMRSTYRRYCQAYSASEGDLKTTHVGRLIIATSGVPTGDLGMMSIKYRWRLFTPQKTRVSAGGFHTSGVNERLTSPYGEPSRALTFTGGELPVDVESIGNHNHLVFNQDWEGIITMEFDYENEATQDATIAGILPSAIHNANASILTEPNTNTPMWTSSFNGNHVTWVCDVIGKVGQIFDLIPSMSTGIASGHWVINLARAVAPWMASIIGLMDDHEPNQPFSKRPTRNRLRGGYVTTDSRRRMPGRIVYPPPEQSSSSTAPSEPQYLDELEDFELCDSIRSNPPIPAPQRPPWKDQPKNTHQRATKQ
jgi:hypothetical protein